MEVKTLLRLIKDDVAHIEGITNDFLIESLPSSDEVELALVRAKTLLKELELLNKIAVQRENISVAVAPAKEPKVEFPENVQHEQYSFESVAKVNVYDEQKNTLATVYQDIIPEEVILDTELNIEDQHNTEGLPGIPIHAITDEARFSAHVEPAEPVDVIAVSPLIAEETDDQPTVLVDPSGAGDYAPISLVILHEQVIDQLPDMGDFNETIGGVHEATVKAKEEASSDQEIPIEASAIVEAVTIPVLKEEMLAEKFSEVKKTLNETLSDQHQMVNDILSPDKDETGYKIIPINSIWDGIGINDRFLFIRELFANSSAKLENTVNALDKMTTIQDAVNYLKMNFKWNKTEAGQKFLVLVKRRFTK